MTMFDPHSLNLSVDVMPFDSRNFPTAIVWLSLAILTIIGNSFIFVLFWKDRSLRTVPNYLVLSLTVTDALVGISRMIFMSLHINKRAWGAGQIGCQLDGYITVVFECQSLLGLVSLGLERYMAVVKRRPLTLDQVAKLVGAIWIYSLILASAQFWGPGSKYVLQSSSLYCVGDWSGAKPGSILFTLMCLSTVTCSLGLFAVAYYYINQTVREASAKWASVQQPSSLNGPVTATAPPSAMAKQNKQIRKNELLEAKLAKKSLVLVIIFVINWTLYEINFLWELIGRKPVPQVVDLFAYTFVLTNSCCNPILFIMLDMRWKRSAREVLGLKSTTSDIEMEDSQSRKASVYGKRVSMIVSKDTGGIDLASQLSSKVSFAQ